MREARIVDTFVEFANTLVEEFDVVEFVGRVTDRCVELLDCAEAGLLLADAAGVLRVLGSSSEDTRALELLQLQNHEGPCFECYHDAHVVVSEDLAEDGGRWPTFAPAAVDAGFRSVHATPMRVHGRTIGALNLFRAEPGGLAAGDVPLSQGLADIAAIGLLHERTLRDAHGTVEQLQAALNSRVVIEQAKGVLAAREQLSTEAAFGHLRAYARTKNLRLRDVAQDLIEGTLTSDAIMSGAEEPAD